MSLTFIHRCFAGALLTTFLISTEAYSNPDYTDLEGPIQAIRVATKTPTGFPNGGLEAGLKSNMRLKPTQVAYKHDDQEGTGYLYVRYRRKEYKIEVEPEIINEIISVVENNKSFKVDVSGGDRTAIGTSNYFNPEIRGTKIAQELLEADRSFAEIARGEIPLPQGAPEHPKIGFSKKLNSNSDFRKLFSNWESLPRIVPMISMQFDPSEKGYVRMESSMHLRWRSSSNVEIEIPKNIEVLAQQNFSEFERDVNRRPQAYRNISHKVDKGAKIVAAMGFLEAACRQPNDCEKLIEQTENFLSIQKEYQVKKRRELSARFFNFEQRYRTQVFPNFQLGNSPDSWSTAYKNFQKLTHEGSFSWPVSRQTKRYRNKVVKQFLNYPVPNDPLLQAALSVILAHKGKSELSVETFEKSINLSASSPLDRIEVLNIGYYVDHLTPPHPLFERLRTLRYQALVDAYKIFDSYLEACFKNLGKCNESELRQREADAFKAGLTYEGTRNLDTDLDLAWLHGRFNYLIGLQLKQQPSVLGDRLRYVSHYAHAPRSKHSTELKELELDMREKLKELESEFPQDSDKIPIVVISLSLISAFLIGTKKVKNNQ